MREFQIMVFILHSWCVPVFPEMYIIAITDASWCQVQLPLHLGGLGSIPKLPKLNPHLPSLFGFMPAM